MLVTLRICALMRDALVAAAEEIADPEYVAAFRRLGAEVRVIDPIPRTRFTEQIPGGTSSFWGFALNKVVVGELLLVAAPRSQPGRCQWWLRRIICRRLAP